MMLSKRPPPLGFGPPRIDNSDAFKALKSTVDPTGTQLLPLYEVLFSNYTLHHEILKVWDWNHFH